MAAPEGITARELLSELLRLARQQSEHKTQDALARVVGVERTTITRGENGHPPTYPVLGDILAQCGVTGLAEAAVRGTWQLARRGDDPVERVAPWHEAVARAHAVRYWQPVLFPGIRQTREYAYEVYRADGRPHEQAERDADARVERQAVLDQDDPPVMAIMLWEAVLYHQVGTPQVMAGQCARLLEVARRPGVLVHVVRSANAGLGGPVSLASVHGEADVLLTGSLLEDTVTSDADQVKRALGIFERCRGIAANAPDTARILTEAQDSWQSR
jgi:hypothetical protein